MSGTYNLERQLRRLSEELSAEAMHLFDAAEVLKLQREDEGRDENISRLLDRMKEYLK